MKNQIRVLIAVLCVCFSADALAVKTIDLFVLGGQSNLLGSAGDAKAYPADPQGFDAKILFYWTVPLTNATSGSWTQLQAQTGLFPAGYFGPEVSFARDLLAVGYRPAIFKYSLGGTSLAEDWKGPGENGLYDKMLEKLRIASAELSKQGYTLKLRALVWIQGENDAKTPDMADAYGRRLSALIDDFRTNVAKDPDLPVILGVDEQHPWVLNHPQIPAAQQRIAAGDKNILFTSMKGLTKADPTHLTPCGLLAHGEILFAAYIKLAGTLPESTANTPDRKPVVSCD